MVAIILLIEDSDVVRDSVAAVLEGAGHIVVAAADGVAGVAAFCSMTPAADLVLTDIVMPEQEGIGTIRQILRHDPSARILAMSGAGSAFGPPILDVARQLGALDTLRKPFKRSELLTKVARCLQADPPDLWRGMGSPQDRVK